MYAYLKDNCSHIFREVVNILQYEQKKCRSAFILKESEIDQMGAQWLSGRVLDRRPRGYRLETHRRHCIVSLVLVQPRKTCPNITERLLTGTFKNQIPGYLAPHPGYLHPRRQAVQAALSCPPPTQVKKNTCRLKQGG